MSSQHDGLEKGQEAASAGMRIVLFLVALGLSTHASSQINDLRIKGRIVNETTGEALESASIRLNNSFKGTIANKKGEFILHLSGSESQDTVLISMIGYFNLLIPVSEVRDRERNLFRLKPNAVMLKQVEVSSGLSANEIVRLAVERIPVNYPVKPYLMKAYYKKTLKENGKYISLVEGAGTVIDKNGFTNHGNRFGGGEEIRLEQARGNFALTSKGPNFIYVNYFLAHFSKNMVKNLDGFFINGQFQREDDIYLDTTTVYVVSAESPTYNFSAWIDSRTFAIVKCVAESKEPKHGQYLDKSSFDSSSYFAATRQVIHNEFQFFEGRYYPKFINVEVDWQIYDKKTGQPFPGMLTTRTSEILINDVQTGDIPVFKKQHLLDRRGGIEYQWKLMGKHYNPKFWANYNAIARSPLEIQLIRDLEKLGPLEEQFNKPIPADVQIKLFKADKKYLRDVLKQVTTKKNR